VHVGRFYNRRASPPEALPARTARVRRLSGRDYPSAPSRVVSSRATVLPGDSCRRKSQVRRWARLACCDAMPDEAFPRAADDPRFIDGIFNYCNRRCEQCRFTEQCRLYADQKRDEQEYPDEDWSDSVRRNFERTIEMIQACCEREGIDFAAMQKPDPD